MMDVLEIQKLLPHRYPFLLVDRVVSIEAGKSLRAYKNVSVNEPFFNGHFPGHPVMPGVLVLEALAQASAILAYRTTGFDPAQKVTYLMAIDRAKFRRPTVPGDRLDLEVEVVRFKGAILKTRGVAKVDGQVVAEGESLRAARGTAAQLGKFDRRAVSAAKKFIKPIPYEELKREIDIFCDLFTQPAVEAGLKKFVESTDAQPYLP